MKYVPRPWLPPGFFKYLHDLDKMYRLPMEDVTNLFYSFTAETQNSLLTCYVDHLRISTEHAVHFQTKLAEAQKAYEVK